MALHRIASATFDDSDDLPYPQGHPARISMMGDRDEGWVLDVVELLDMAILDGDTFAVANSDDSRANPSTVELAVETIHRPDGRAFKHFKSKIAKSGRDHLAALPPCPLDE